MDKLSNTKFFPHNKEQSKRMQEYAFSLGYTWFLEDKVVQHGSDFLFFDEEPQKSITRMDLLDREDYDENHLREIYFEDIFDDHLINHEDLASFKEEMKKYGEG